MSNLDCLTILGVRNFGIRAENQQRIDFQSPVTLIVGPNGSGKTTILESIKYALTGDFPPNCSSGQSFLHNPRQVDTSEVKGIVRLRVVNKKGEIITIARSGVVSSSTKRNSNVETLKFRQLDSTVSIEGDDTKTLHKRGDEVSVYACQLLGVSRSVINYVLFCHQEESDWPLGTDTMVKERFDRIFETDRCNKLLERLRKRGKDSATELKIAIVTLDQAQYKKNEFDENSLQLSNKENLLTEASVQADKLMQQIEEIEIEIGKIQKLQKESVNLENDRTTVKTKIEEKENRLEEIQGKITEPFTGNKSDLEIKFRSFERIAIAKTREMEQLKREYDLKKSEEDSVVKSINKINMDLAGLIENRKCEQSLYTKKAKITRELCNLLNIPITFDIDNCDERSNEYADDIQAKMLNKNAEFDKQKSDCKNMITRIEQIIEKAKYEKNQKDIQRTENSKRIIELNQESSKLKEQIRKCEHDADQLKKIDSEIDNVKRQYDNPENAEQMNASNELLNNKKEEQKELNDRLDDLDCQIMIVSENTETNAQINLKKQDLKKNNDQAKKFLNKHDKNIAKLFGDQQIEKDFKRHVDTLMYEQKNKLKKLDENVRKCERSENECKNNIKHKREDLSKQKIEIQRLHEQIYDLCSGETYDEVLERTREETAMLQMKLSTLRSSELMNKTYVEELTEKPACPLCNTCLEHDEVETLKDDLVKRTETLPFDIIEAERKYNNVNRKLEKLIALEKDVHRYKTLSENVKCIEQEISDLEKKNALELKKLKEIKEEYNELQTEYNLATSIQSDMVLLDKAKQTVAALEQDIQSLSVDLSADINVSMEDLQNQRKVLNETKRSVNKKIENFETNIKEMEQNNSRLSERLNKLQSQKITIQDNIQSLTSRINRSKEIEKTIENVEHQNEVILSELRPLNEKLKQLIEEKSNFNQKNEIKLNKSTEELTILNNLIRDDKKLKTEIEQYGRKDLQNQLNKNRDILKSLGKKRDDIVEDKNNMAERISEIEKSIKYQDSVKRNFDDNMTVFALKEEIDVLKKRLNELNEKKIAINDKKYKELSERYSKINSELNKSAGSRSEIETQVKDLKRKLTSEPMKSAINTYREAVIKKLMIGKRIQSFNATMAALEYAMIEYHKDKMAQINSVIRDLWRSIYRGNDIDYIEVETAADEANYKSTTKKRSYNYRVIQCKNGYKSILRGNCSAGQRVLASLIIRIALAETFSSNCDVLALDEPTTNLDQANINALVDALNELITERSRNSGFQLIIITHDKAFIHALGGFDSYFELDRDRKGISRITEKKKSILTDGPNCLF